jgi:uncharacterized membrane protein
MPPQESQAAIPPTTAVKRSFMTRALSLDIRPYGRGVYTKSVFILWGLCLLWAVVLGIVSALASAFGGLFAENITTSVGYILIYIFFAYYLHEISVFRVEDAGDNKNLAWLAVVPYLNFLFAVIYFARPGKPQLTPIGVTPRPPVRKGLLVFTFLFCSVAFGAAMVGLMDWYTHSLTWGIWLGICGGLLFGTVFTLKQYFSVR